MTLPPGRRETGGGRWRRRGRLFLFAGGSAFLLLAVGLLVLRPRPKPYAPGTEAASSDEITRALSRSRPEDAPRVRFSDVAGPSGIRFRHFHGERSMQLPEDMGSGAAWGDYDNDGDPDLFLVNEAGPLTADDDELARSPARSALYRNDGDGSFTEVTDGAGVGARGWGMAAAWGDYDGDGRLDLVVTRFGTSLLYRNRGDGTFAEVSATTGIAAEQGFWAGASWADYDRDGDLDLYICGYVRYRYDLAASGRTSVQYQAVVPYTLNPSAYPPERNLLFRNDRGMFHEVARQAGVDNPTGRSLSAAWCDFDADGWPDLYVANDISDNAMFRNLGNGGFEDVSHSAWVADYRGAMGLGVGDWENDGDFDLFVTHWIAQENALYANQGPAGSATGTKPLRFLDIADQVGVGQIALDFIGWGTDFIDYDNDGRLDLFVVNGSTFQRPDDPSRLVPMKNQLFWNGGPKRGFFDVGAASGESFAVENVGRGAAFADYDADGDVDAAIIENGGEARLLRNDGGNERGWLRVVLRGPAAAGPGRARGRRPATTTYATGALVKVTTGTLIQVREIGSGPSYLSQSPPGEVRFGVGSARTIETLEISWPDGTRQAFRDLAADSTVAVVQGQEPVVTPREGRGDLRRAEVLRFWQLFNEATEHRRSGRFTACARAYEEALVLKPRHEDSLYYLGQCRRELGLLAPARDAFTRLVEVNPGGARGHLALGALLASPVAGGPLDLAGAERHFRRAHDINREETGPMVRLAEVLIVRGDVARAREWLQASLRSNPKSVEAAFLLGYLQWESRDLEGSRAFYVKAVQASRSEAPIQGVLGEGDRKGPPAGGRRQAAAPLKWPMGRTLFGSFVESLRDPDRGVTDPESDVDLDSLYAPVRRFIQSHRDRAAAER